MSISSLLLVVALVVVTAKMTSVLALPATVPAFLWSHNLEGAKEIVDYRVLSPRDLAKTVMTEGGWLDYLCPVETTQKPPKFAFLFVGKELNSMDITRPSKADPVLVDLLKDSFSNSNSSVAFPYLTAAAEKEPIENSVLSEFADSCQHSPGISRVTLVGSCIAPGENHRRLTDIHSINDYLNSRIENALDEGGDLIVLCNGASSIESDRSDSESTILSQLLNSVRQLGVKYSVLYVSDPFRYTQNVKPHHGLERFLAEGTIGNASLNSTLCDNVCQMKSSLLEGLFVGIVLLIILISGLCCMMGIDTPSRFETPQEN